MKIFYKILSIFIVVLFFISFSKAASVDAWPDQTWDETNDISLVWSYSGLTGCSISVMRWSDLYIDMPYDLTNARIYTHNLSGATWWNYEVELKISTDGMCEDSSESYSQYRDTINLCVPNDWFVCSGWPSTWSSWWWKSHATRMREEAVKLFKDETSISNIELILEWRSIFFNTLYGLYWNYIWWDWEIQYELQYSTGEAFDTLLSLDKYNQNKIIKSRDYTVYVHDLNNDSIIHYFRVRAFYKDKYTNWSNIVSYVNEDNPLSKYKVKCIWCGKDISYKDIWNTPDLLIEKDFILDCKLTNTCKKVIDYSDVFGSVFYRPTLK
jgi:hypothetical protein